MSIKGYKNEKVFTGYYESDQDYTITPYNYYGEVLRVSLIPSSFAGGADNDGTSQMAVVSDDGSTTNTSFSGIHTESSSVELYATINLPKNITKILASKIYCYQDNSSTGVNDRKLIFYIKQTDGLGTKMVEKEAVDNPLNTIVSINHSFTQDTDNPYFLIIYVATSSTLDTITGGWVDIAV